ncbi:MAG: N-acetylneuraminate synthase family protein [Bacteroidota bacterium]
MEDHTTESIYTQLKNISLRWKTNKIYIVGKGPSIDHVSKSHVKDGLIININDSEKILNGDIGVFSANWVRKSLKDAGFTCDYYLAGKPLPEDINHSVLPPLPFELDDEELLAMRVSNENFYDESFTLINALKVTKALGDIKGCVPEVFVLGFDFSLEKGELSQKIKVDYASSKTDRNLMVHSHEHYFIQLLHYFKQQSGLLLHHVGDKNYSYLTVSRFISKKDTDYSIQSPVLSDDRVWIVAELTNNHLGDMDRLVRMVELAKESGADLIKVQKRDVDTFYSKEKLSSYYYSPFGTTLRDYRVGVELTDTMLEALDQKCKELGIQWFCSVLDYTSFEIIRKFNPMLVKIPSTISNHKEFHKKLAANYNGPIVISTGLTDKKYEDYVMDTFKDNEQVFLLHCVSAYPAPNSDCNIAVVKHYSRLSEKFQNVIPGYSSHDSGSFGSILAVAAGAKMIEKHVKLGDVEWVHFDTVAMDLESEEFKNYIQQVRKAEEALGSPIKRKLPSEHHKYEVNGSLS